ncbi:MAG: radical SAM protein [Eubacteriaceae bacterium]|jgi:MoaA/NifB/PqqE/SkfB family radical SAM enzyme|nr:radical SAM protein [Eubacteriaceae bacterium]
MNNTENDITLGQYDLTNLFAKLLISNKNNPKMLAFLARYANYRRKADSIRKKNAEAGLNIPAFLNCSITDFCNLNCQGCYARASLDDAVRAQLSIEKWNDIFAESVELGIATIFILGGEPLVRKDVIEAAAKYPQILFFIFTNSTLIDDYYLSLFDEHRNLVPLLSIEGFEAETDARRGKGVYKAVTDAMDKLSSKGLLFGNAITVTRDNINTVLSDAFLNEMQSKGGRIIEFIEYVPFEHPELVLDNEGRDRLAAFMEECRTARNDMIALSFPGDERKTQGCIAGKAFFHISAAGDVEPCPFMPFSDTNIREMGIIEALKSPFFKLLHTSGIQGKENLDGGCLYTHKDKVIELLEQSML